MGSTNNRIIEQLILKRMGKYDSRYSQDIRNAAKKLHRQFPDMETINEISVVDEVKDSTTLASMYYESGILEFNSRVLNNYDDQYLEEQGLVKRGWHAGDGTLENSLISHELAHWLDTQIKRLSMDKDTGELFPFQLDDKGDMHYIDDMPRGISDIVVPQAIKNLQDNFKQFGFTKKPTVNELVGSMSGYANSYNPSNPKWKTVFKDRRDPAKMNAEIFAESYADYSAYRTNAHILAREVMRLTKQAYKTIVRQRKG